MRLWPLCWLLAIARAVPAGPPPSPPPDAAPLQIIAAGTPEEVAASAQSHTGAFLAPMLNVKPRKSKRPKAKAA